jgi:exonuclease SbcC
VKLQRLRLINFRQHADTDIVLGDGVTGIIGPNGSGKSTLLEAIAWAIYGTPAVRGDKDGIRNLRASGRASVQVELEFALGRHEYRVVRGLHGAELYEDGRPLANAQRAVTDKLERLLGMGREEFFNTYFTGQKELAVMAALKPVERAAFLSRVLGYERLRDAQERVRERRNALSGEVKGMEARLPDGAALEQARAAALARLAEARQAAAAADAARGAARSALKQVEPEWRAWIERRDAAQKLEADRRVAEQAVEQARRDFQRLDRELAEAAAAREALRGLAPDLAPIAQIKEELSALERLQQEDVARQRDEVELRETRTRLAELERRVAELAAASEELPRAEREAADVARRLVEAERAAEEARTTWVQERQYAETKRAELLKQWEEVKEQKERIATLGPEGECPTCRRPLGGEYAAVVGVLERQLEAITGDGKYFRQRVEQLAEAPPRLREAEAARDRLLEVQQRAGRRIGELRAQGEERDRARVRAEAARRRADEVAARLAARAQGYDRARHDAVRAELARLEPIAREATALEVRAGRAETLIREAELAERELSRREERAAGLGREVAAVGFAPAAFEAARERHDAASLALREAELQVVETRGNVLRAEEQLQQVDAREAERAALEQHLAGLKRELRLHNELDRAFSDLRGELNAAVRPEIAELASRFLGDLTDGRYDEVDLDESYRITVLDDGIPKPVISGGEEDIANLVLRLAISQMIAERAGQPLSLLVLDEIFGSLDDVRRQHVVGLLRRLADRFPQVVLITHVEQVRDGLDRVLRVEYDPATAMSVVRDDTATLGAADAGVAA